jgi:glycine cleavage system H protein
MSTHPEVRGCILPLHLHYSVSDHTWVQLQDDGIAIVGMTDVAQNLAGPLLHAKPKKVGTTREQGKPVATVESSKWVGPVKSPLSGEIVATNEALEKDATLINKSPYQDGWIVRMKPSNPQELAGLLTGQAAVDAYRARIEKENLKACTRIEGCQI